MREKPVEVHLRDEVKIRGGFCIKLNPNWNKGIPDRLVILPGVVAFVETKRPKGGILATIQQWWRKRLTALGCEYYLLCTKAQVDDFLRNFPVRTSHVD